MHTVLKSAAALVAAAVVAAVLGVPQGAADAAPPAAWVGAAVDGTWPGADGCPATYPSATCSLPASHHTYAYGMPYAGDFAFDEQSIARGAGVYLYVAPQSRESITTKVEQVTYACAARSGETAAERLARGGHAVVVGVYAGSARIGWVTFVHVNASVTKGATVARWGTRIGTVGDYTSNGCWRGRHLHMELTNQANYACFNKGWKPGQRMYRTNFVGFVGGAFASAPRRACP